MKKTLIFVVLFIGAVTSDSTPYRARGWRPSGRIFEHERIRLHTQYGPPSQSYEPPENGYLPPPPTTTPATTTTTTTMRTTTIKSREPTTPSSPPEEDFDTNPALAIANSFAFNRPVYVYNTFPFVPAHVLVKR